MIGHRLSRAAAAAFAVFLVMPALAVPAAAELVARRALQPGTTLVKGDIAAPGGGAPGPAARRLIGLRLTRALATGEPIRAADLALPHVVARNDRVQLGFRRGGLRITTAGRALSDGALGGRVQVLNLASGQIVEAMVTGPATAEVGP